MLDFEGSVQKGKKGKGILHLEKGCLDGHRNISLRQSVWYVGIPDYLMTLHGKPLTTVTTGSRFPGIQFEQSGGISKTGEVRLPFVQLQRMSPMRFWHTHRFAKAEVDCTTCINLDPR
jgi:hypothetical protein